MEYLRYHLTRNKAVHSLVLCSLPASFFLSCSPLLVLLLSAQDHGSLGTFCSVMLPCAVFFILTERSQPGLGLGRFFSLLVLMFFPLFPPYLTLQLGGSLVSNSPYSCAALRWTPPLTPATHLDGYFSKTISGTAVFEIFSFEIVYFLLC